MIPARRERKRTPHETRHARACKRCARAAAGAAARGPVRLVRINLHAFDGERALGDLRIWRARRRREFEPHDKALLDLIEPAFIAALRRARPAAAPSAGWALSPREREVALAVLRGLTDKQVARELGLPVSSVRTYLGRLFEKTGATRRAGMAQSVQSRSP